MKNKNYKLAISFIMLLCFLSIKDSNSQTMCTEGSNEQISGVQDGFRYELWNQNAQGTACITVESGALFSGEWDGILNYLARRGLAYNETQEHNEIGAFYTTYDCDYNPDNASGNSYLSIYGWTVDPLIEFYIVEDWRNWIPSMDANATFKGSFTANGSVYDIYENTRTNQPSIKGTATFQQYFSIRRDVRNSGTINISEHFNKWESIGLDMGKMYEVSFVVEGYKSNGSFAFSELDISVEDISSIEIEESKPIKITSVYPNPASESISIKLDETMISASITIYNALGESIISQEISNDTPIPISNLKSGMYFVSINSKNQSYTCKLLVK